MNIKSDGLRIFITTFVCLMVVVIIIASLGYYIGQSFADYGDQHYYFINNLRQNYFATKDLFPQLNMNLGLGQSMSTMIYHGYLNPYIMVSYFFASISTQMVMSIIVVLTISLTTSFSYILLRKHNFHKNICLICAYIFGFAPFLIFHAHYHPMYIYYIPYAMLNLIAIHRLVEKKHIGLLTLSFSMIFFLNFFFAPIVTIVNAFYFILLISKEKEKKPYIFLYIKSYIISLLISLVILLPNFILFLNSPRVPTTGSGSEIVGLNFGFILQVTLNPYCAAMGIIVLCALIYHLFVHNNKQMLIITIFILVISMFSIINYILNVFQYVNYKQLIYIMPLALILVANFLNEQNRIKILVSRLVTVFLIFLLMITGFFATAIYNLIISLYPHIIDQLNGRALFDTNFIYFIFFGFIIYLILQYYITHINLKRISSLKTAILCILVATVSFVSFSIFVPKMEEQAYTQMQTTDQIYRDEATESNNVEDIDSFTPTIYASMVNRFYSEMLKTDLEVEVNGNERRVNQDIFNNEIMRFIFGIDDQGEEVMPIVYSKENEDIYNAQALEETNQLLALLNGDFTTSSTNSYNPPELEIQTIDETITATGDELSHIYDYEYTTDGVLYISFDASNDLCDKGFVCSITINDHKNDIYSYSKSLYSPNDNFVYVIDINESVENLDVKASIGTWTLDNFKYTFIPDSQIEELKKTYTPVDDYQVDINNGYTFTTNLQTDGYVFTTIPYDSGFNVYVDGEKVEAEIVNNYFLGFAVPSGYHEVEITYIMPGFIFGGVTTMIGLIMLTITLYSEYVVKPIKLPKRKQLKKVKNK